MNFKDLKLSKSLLNTYNTPYIYIDNQGTEHEITVKKTLLVSQKNDIIAISLQKAEIDGIYNELLLDVFFHLNIIYSYTNLEFDDNDRLDEMELYDLLESNQIIDNVIAHMEETNEYSNLREMLMSQLDRNTKAKGTAAAVLRTLVSDLPASAQAAKNIVDGFNPDDYKQVVNFAMAANAGRPIQ